MQKHLFDFRPPKRWEPAIFRNPVDPSEIYVKRITGLPGETIHINGGDVYANGEICRKSWARQRSLAINVYDNRFRPPIEDGWQPRWLPDDGWTDLGGEFASRPDSWQPGQWSWVRYRHWLRRGGTHTSAVALPVTQESLSIGEQVPGVKFDATTRQLVCVGVMTDQAAAQLKTLSRQPEFLAAVDMLHQLSHQPPIVDWYGYNDPDVFAQAYRGSFRPEVTPEPVRDLLWLGTLEPSPPIVGRASQFAVEMTDGVQTWRVTIDFLTRELTLREIVDGQAGEPLRETVLSAETCARSLQLGMSIFDRQIHVAINDEPVLAPWLMDAPLPTGNPPRQPVRFGSRGLAVIVRDLQLFRDVHYRDVANPRVCTLGENEYFMLGDNSPVSRDSRKWPTMGVHQRLFLGKPFVTHLPSRQLKLKAFNSRKYLRVPDFSRLRFIR